MGIKAFDARLLIGRENIMGDRPKITIESVETYGRNLYIGTSDYYIHHYLMNLPSNETEFPSDYLNASRNIRRQLNYKKSPVQIRAAPTLNFLLVNCDGLLVMVNMMDLSAVSSVSGKIKNIRKIEVNKRPMSQNPLCVEICVSFTKKKVLQILQIHEDRIVPLQEISLSTQVENFAIDNYCILMCSHSSYTLVHCENGQKQELFSFGSDTSNNNQLHLVEPLGNSEFLISAAGALGVFVTADGTSNRPPMQWSEGVFTSCLVDPYIIALSSELITVHNIADQQMKQSLNFQGGFQLSSCDDGSVLVSTAKDIFALQAIPLQQQVKLLLDQQLVDEAVNLVKSSRHKLSRHSYDLTMQRINCMAGFVRFGKQEFDECLGYFDEGLLDPRELICLFSHLLRSTSNFKRAQPPLNQIPNILHLCENDEAKIWAYQEFLMKYLEHIKQTDNNDVFIDVVFASVFNLMNLQEFEKVDNYIHCTPTEIWKKLLQETDQTNFVTTFEKQSCHHLLALVQLKCGYFSQAFDQWKLIAESKVQDPTFPGLKFVSQKLTQLCNNKTLFLSNVQWIMKLDQECGVENFIQSATRLQISHDDVIELLERYPEALVIYLRHLVAVEKVEKEKLHTRLVTLLLERVFKELGKKNSGEKLEKCRCELREILKMSTLYRVNLILGKVEEAGLHEEQVLLYARLGEHEKSLGIIVSKIKDRKLAEEYCIENYTEENKVFMKLLSIYVQGLVANPENSFAIMELLNKHSSKFDIDQVLRILPGHWPVNTLMRFLQNGARSPEHQLRTKNIELMMLKSRLKELYNENRAIESQQVVLHEGKTCNVCNRVFSDEPFVRFPNGIIVHITCSRDPHICPVTGQVFKHQTKLQQN